MGIFIVVLVSFILLLASLVVNTAEEGNKSYTRTWAIVGIISVLVVVVLIAESYKGSYKQGQIDAMTNKIEYKLVTNPDSTKTWVKIEKK